MNTKPSQSPPTSQPGAKAGGAQLPTPGRPQTGRRRGALPKVDLSYITIGVVVVVGGICLFLLRSRLGPAQAVAEQEIRVIRLKSGSDRASMDAKARAVVQSLRCEARERQIPLERLEGNPFVLKAGAKAASDVIVSSGSGANRAQQQALETFKKLKLQTVVMTSRGGQALISGELVAVGDDVEGWKVQSITRSKVVLRCQGIEKSLVIPE